jgi:hypothetical protein
VSSSSLTNSIARKNNILQQLNNNINTKISLWIFPNTTSIIYTDATSKKPEFGATCNLTFKYKTCRNQTRQGQTLEKSRIKSFLIFYQFISIPPSAHLRVNFCVMCNKKFFGVSEESLRQHFKKVTLRHLVKHHLADTNVSREKGLLLSFVYKFGQVACRCC